MKRAETPRLAGELIIARLLCQAVEIYPGKTGLDEREQLQHEKEDKNTNEQSVEDDRRVGTDQIVLCLQADGRLQTADKKIDWYVAGYGVRKRLRREHVRTDVGGWKGVCSSDGHITLLANSKKEGSRLLTGRLLPPCCLSGTVAREDGLDTGRGKTGRFEINLETVEMAGCSKTATWDLVLVLLKRLREYQFAQCSSTTASPGQGPEGSDFSAYLPLEAIFNVCGFLPVESVLALASCSKAFNHLCSDPWLWKQLYLRRFGPHSLLEKRIGPPATAAAVDSNVEGHSIRDLMEGYLTPVAEVEKMWNHQPWPLPEADRGDSFASEESEGEEQGWQHRYQLAATKDPVFLASHVIKDGDYILDGHTRNDGPGNNITRVEGVKMRLRNGLLWAEMQYLSGSTYNRRANAVWAGRYYPDRKEIKWRERYMTHRGLFHYTGRVVDHETITGTYHWDVNGARGTFQLHLARQEL